MSGGLPPDAFGVVVAAWIRLKNEKLALDQEVDQWKVRAKSAEARLIEIQSSTDDSRFEKLRRLIAKELHPDFCADGSEKLVRQELFKRIWSKIDQIA
jgi:hypothetical protein